VGPPFRAARYVGPPFRAARCRAKALPHVPACNRSVVFTQEATHTMRMGTVRRVPTVRPAMDSRRCTVRLFHQTRPRAGLARNTPAATAGTRPDVRQSDSPYVASNVRPTAAASSRATFHSRTHGHDRASGSTHVLRSDGRVLVAAIDRSRVKRSSHPRSTAGGPRCPHARGIDTFRNKQRWQAGRDDHARARAEQEPGRSPAGLKPHPTYDIEFAGLKPCPPDDIEFCRAEALPHGRY
jgi:hypothetical protein